MVPILWLAGVVAALLCACTMTAAPDSLPGMLRGMPCRLARSRPAPEQTNAAPAPAEEDRRQVATALAAIQPGDAESADTAEQTLVGKGASIVPALREALPGSTGEARGVLTNALVRLVWKINPRQLLTDWIAKRTGSDGRPNSEPIRPIPAADDPLLRTFPDYRFYVIRFRQFPVARVVPDTLHPSNVFAISKLGKVEYLEDSKALQSFFQASPLRAPQTGNLLGRLQDAVYSWLRLSEEFVQDGFYKFTIPDDSLKILKSERGWDASGKAVVASGGRGEINATLTYDLNNQIVGLKESTRVQQGVRPICQATKLLDPDPVVRRMAEQDLLIMGTAARPYILEQRALARPELQEAIDRMWQRMAARDRDFETGTTGTISRPEASFPIQRDSKGRRAKQRTR